MNASVLKTPDNTYAYCVSIKCKFTINLSFFFWTTHFHLEVAIYENTPHWRPLFLGKQNIIVGDTR